MSAPFGRICEHGRSASHSYACYYEEYGESKEDLLGGDEPPDRDEDEEEAEGDDEE